MTSQQALTNLMSGKSGEYKRNPAKHRVSVASKDAQPQPEPGRYHLHVALACPWAAGALSVLYLKGLEHVISVSIVHPTWARTKPEDETDEHCGWVYRKPGDAPLPNSRGHGANACDEALRPDTATNCKSIREVYELCGDLQGPFTTPVLWDKKESKIVSNESMDILRILNFAFNGLARNPAVDLYPVLLEAYLSKLNAELIYPKVNNGVYRCGFARSQQAYDGAVEELFASLEELESRLGRTRFLGGDAFCWLDLRLFHTLVRFDPVYTCYFKTNQKRIADYPNLLAFCRDVYSMEPIRRSINMAHIKTHYFTSHPHLNPFGIIPVSDGPNLDAPHGRGPALSELAGAKRPKTSKM